LSDLQSYLSIASLLHAIFRTVAQHVTRFQLTDTQRPAVYLRQRSFF